MDKIEKRQLDYGFSFSTISNKHAAIFTRLAVKLVELVRPLVDNRHDTAAIPLSMLRKSLTNQISSGNKFWIQDPTNTIF